MIKSTLGAPFGGTTLGGQYDLESLASRPMTPPNGAGGGGIYFPSMVLVALGEPGVPVISWDLAEGAAGAGCAKRRGRHGLRSPTLRGFRADHRPVLERLSRGPRERHPTKIPVSGRPATGRLPQCNLNRIVKMQSWSKITHCAGFDWAHDHHEVVIVNRSGKIVADFQIEHTAQGWQRWREQVAALGPELAACVCGRAALGTCCGDPHPLWVSGLFCRARSVSFESLAVRTLLDGNRPAQRTFR
jgi:hypothetical protein